MRTILNIIWLVFAGFALAVGYVIAGIVCCLLIVTIPFGIASFRLAGYVLWPFGREIVVDPRAGGITASGNALWVIVAGLWLVLTHLITAGVRPLTTSGVPPADAHRSNVPRATAAR